MRRCGGAIGWGEAVGVRGWGWGTGARGQALRGGGADTKHFVGTPGALGGKAARVVAQIRRGLALAVSSGYGSAGYAGRAKGVRERTERSLTRRRRPRRLGLEAARAPTDEHRRAGDLRRVHQRPAAVRGVRRHHPLLPAHERGRKVGDEELEPRHPPRHLHQPPQLRLVLVGDGVVPERVPREVRRGEEAER